MLCDLLLSAATVRAPGGDKSSDCGHFGAEHWCNIPVWLRRRVLAHAKSNKRSDSFHLLHPPHPALGCPRAPVRGCCTLPARQTEHPILLLRKANSDTRNAPKQYSVLEADHLPASSHVHLGSWVSVAADWLLFAKLSPSARFTFCRPYTEKATLRTAVQDASALGCHLHLISP